MSARNFKDFISAYVTWADNGHAPSKFHRWSAISIVAGALERKVWLPWDDTFSYYPNLYIFLVANPGIGKSSASEKAVELLSDMNRVLNGNISFVPSQVTQAKLIDLMSRGSSFEIGTKIFAHSSGYYHASEASNSFTNIYGDFIACVTDFYGCPQFWERSTKKDGTITLKNICLNIIAGSTFDYLGKVVTDENIMGGFASRVIYVMFKDKLDRVAKFQGGEDPADAERAQFRVKLMEDLRSIHGMAGSFSGTREFAERYESWAPENQRQRQELESEKMQSLLVRKETNLMKLSMVLSASESSDRVLKAHHWDQALELLDETERDLPTMIRESKALQTDTQSGLAQALLNEFARGPKTVEQLKVKLSLKGFNPQAIDINIANLLAGNALTRDGSRLKLLINPDSHL